MDMAPIILIDTHTAVDVPLLNIILAGHSKDTNKFNECRQKDNLLRVFLSDTSECVEFKGESRKVLEEILDIPAIDRDIAERLWNQISPENNKIEDGLDG